MWCSVCQGTGGGVSLGRYGHLTYFQRQLRVSRGLYITGAARKDGMSREQQPSRWSRKMAAGMRSRICVCSEAYLCVGQEEQGKSPGCLEHSEAPSPPPVLLCLLSLPCPTDLSGSATLELRCLSGMLLPLSFCSEAAPHSQFGPFHPGFREELECPLGFHPCGFKCALCPPELTFCPFLVVQLRAKK